MATVFETPTQATTVAACSDAAIYAAFDAARADGRPFDALRIAYNRRDLFDWSGDVPDDFTDEEAIEAGLS